MSLVARLKHTKELGQRVQRDLNELGSYLDNAISFYRTGGLFSSFSDLPADLDPERLWREGARQTENVEQSGPAKNFAVATIKVRDGEAVQFWRVLAFSAEAQSELLRLDDGDALSVQGGLRAEARSGSWPFRAAHGRSPRGQGEGPSGAARYLRVSRLSRFLNALSEAGRRDHGRGYDKIAAMTGIDLTLLRNVNSPNHKTTLTGDKVRVVELFPSAGNSKAKTPNTFSADAVLKAIAELKGTSKRAERRKKQRVSDARRKQKQRFDDKERRRRDVNNGDGCSGAGVRSWIRFRRHSCTYRIAAVDPKQISRSPERSVFCALPRGHDA